MLPDSATLRAAKAEFERTLQPGTHGHMAWCLGKMASGMASRKGDHTSWAMRTEAWLDACGHFPDDLWTKGALELLQTKTYIAAPAEMVEIVGPLYRERQRMLERVKLMLGSAAVAEKPKTFVQDPADVRLRTMRDSLKRIGKVGRAARYERDLAALEGRSVEDWAAGEIPEGTVAKDAVTDLPPIGPETQARTLVALAKTWRKNGNIDRAEALERQALALAPHVFEPAPEHRDIPEVSHG